MQNITIKNKLVNFPIYLPDATYGVIKGLDSLDLLNCNLEAIVVNTFHLSKSPGLSLIQELGGIHEFMNFAGLVTSDSGGFQLFSLIKKNPDMGKITNDGLIIYAGPKKQSKHLFTPEESIQMQFALGSDVMICLDDFTPDTADIARIKQSVSRTLTWAQRCKLEFERQISVRNMSETTRPILLGVSQGHKNYDLRGKCIDGLIKIGFDGYGLGGWMLTKTGEIDLNMCAFDAQRFPNDKPKFALGVGKPHDIGRLRQQGWDFFDCVIPTRNARHGQVYILTSPINEVTDFTNQIWYQTLTVTKNKLANDTSPLDQYCQCHTCKHHSRAYLNHLFKHKSAAAFRLATIHNLWFYTAMINKLRQLEK